MMEPRKVAQYQRSHLPMIRALVDDPEGLGQALALVEQLQAEVAYAARLLHDEAGFSWREIGRGAGREGPNAYRSWHDAPETESARVRREKQALADGFSEILTEDDTRPAEDEEVA